MCRSRAEGGARCAAYTRRQLQQQSFPGPEWDEAAGEHAATRAGQGELLAESQAAEAAGDVERAVALAQALVRGQQIRAGVEATRQELARRAEAGGGEVGGGGVVNARLAAALLANPTRTFTMAPDPSDPAFPGRAVCSVRSWDVADPDYAPNAYVTPKIAKRINAGGEKNVDPNWHERWASEVQWADGATPRLAGPGVPLNPAGRTGLVGLGGCKRLGENKAADPIVTRTDPVSGKTQVLLGYKDAEQQWALPGGTVDEGESPASACSRELLEEVGLSVDMSRGRVVYQGFVDDHRNTDNAWFATQARHVHLDGEAAQQEPRANDDISAARWVDVDSLRSGDLFASHGPILAAAGLLHD